ncbi:NAD(P)-binding protein [Macroventuria anomochaeta]|uniref:NAD(P)-binding protein n=1 Tax=Macroventuria anomochaeta TaxID=301207 RepID=A0ACB6SJ51_9PLEO|nr:NAD(P)-binding protein [Macroventuria anomochaeta]KAF2633503.1 NAD(P)-binding protein [Macroventuria anomochaeta]
MSVGFQRVANLISLSVSHLALNPVITASLLYILTKGPVNLRARLTNRIAALRDPIRHAQIIKALKWLLTLGLLKNVNKMLNDLALNSYRLRPESARWKWDKEVAVVTGGCSGIGSLIVKRLITKGVTVAILDVQSLPPALQGYAHIKFYACDITDPDAVFRTAKEIRTTLGSPSILINNAGILSAHTILATSHEYLRKIFDVNVLSNWTTVQAFLPDMIKENKGHVVTIASTASYVGVAGLADYNASKAAILSFHEALNQELRVYYNAPSILTSSIHPNWVRTPLLAPVEAELKKRGVVVIEPEDVADAVLKQVFSCRGAQVFVPASAGKSSLVRALPNWLQESVRKGVSKTITKSVGVGGM